MLKTILPLFILMIGLFTATVAHAQNNPNPIVVELFTSQGCSSCPPADKLLAEIADNPNLITIAHHVTYWDRLGWKDSLGQKFATERQKEYTNHMRLGQMYTPQMIVNGNDAFVGFRKNELTTALKNATPVIPIALENDNENVLKINLPDLRTTKNKSYSLYLYAIDEAADVKIQTGENRGKMFTYKNSALFERPLGIWMGFATTKYIPLPNIPEADHYILLINEDRFGPIIAAGKLEL